MSFNHLNTDSCTYKRILKENVSMLSYVMSPIRYEHQEKCRHELGLLGGTGVSHISGNLVDLESELRGQTRYLTKCVTHQYTPLKVGEPIKNDKTEPIDTTPLHLPGCQMISYKRIPIPQAETPKSCL